MIIVMKAHATNAEIQNVVRMVEELEYRAHIITGVERSVVACVGEERGEERSLLHLESVAGVERVMPVLRSFKLASREVCPTSSVVDLGRGVAIGGEQAGVMAAPCPVERAEQIGSTAAEVEPAGAKVRRRAACPPTPISCTTTTATGRSPTSPKKRAF